MLVNVEQIFLEKRARLEVVWRNPVASVQANLRVQEANNPYCGWAEQSSNIRARRTNWESKHIWAR